MEDKIYNIEIINSGLFSFHQLIKLKFTSSELIISNADKNEDSQKETIYFREIYINIKYEEEQFILKLISEKGKKFIIQTDKKNIINDIEDNLKDFKLKLDKEINLNKYYMSIYYKIFAAITEINKKINKLGNIYKKYFDKIKDNITLNKTFNFDNEEEEEIIVNEKEDILSESKSKNSQEFYLLNF